MDKTKAMISFLMTCPYITSNPLFYNFGKFGSDTQHVKTRANDINTSTPFIDGSVQKQFTLILLVYKPVADRAILNRSGVSDENIDNEVEVQQVIDWVRTQAKARNFPNFGSDCTIDDMTVTSDEPNTNGVDKAVTPVLAKYSISIRIDYIDYSEAI